MKSSCFRLAPLALAIATTFPVAAQLPTNPRLVNGSAVISQTDGGLRVSNTPGTILNWDSFSIGSGRGVEFEQLGPGSAVLNRVTGNTRSEILGALTSNGRVFLLNPNGVLFGNGARVDVQGLVASTLQLSDDDFLAGNYRFTCSNGVSCDFGAPDSLNPTRNKIVLEDGSEITTRTAGNGGQVWLIARSTVESEKGSRIDAPLGQVAAAAGREVIVTSPNLGAITFTLDRIAGTRIDLGGDIDVERGAAGFFADSIRFGGGVRARSAIDGAGQIVARAGSGIDVDDDARLDVSGGANADGGAVRLRATQTIRVSAASEIAADGGAPGVGGTGGKGGLIDLEAAEVQLPWLLGDSAQSPIQLHARGFGDTGSELARYGRIDVRETGRFSYGLVDGPSWTAEDSSSDFSSSGVEILSNATSLDQDVQITGIAPSGDGLTLVLTRRTELDRSQAERQSSSISTSEFSTARSELQELHVVDATGNVVDSLLLSSEAGASTQRFGFVQLPEHQFEAVGLSKGGWVVRESGVVNQLLFIDAAGNEVRRVPVDADASLQALLSGGLLLRSTVDGAAAQTVFDANGVAARDTAAALAAENLARPLERLDAGQLNFDERRGLRVSNTTVLEQIDRSSDTVERSSNLPLPSRLAGTVNGTVLLSSGLGFVSSGNTFETNSQTTTTTTDIGALDGDQYTALLATRGTSSSFGGFVSSADPIRRSSFELVEHKDFRVLDSNSIGVVTTASSGSANSETTAIVEPSPTGTGSRITVVRRGGGSVTTAVSFNQVTRKLESTPFAEQNVSGSYLALPGAASTPGISNGSRNVPVTPPVTPEDPGTPTTPTPPGPTNPPAGGVRLEIRPPQTELPPLGRQSAPRPPGSDRPKGPTAEDAGKSDDDIIYMSPDEEEELAEKLIKDELGDDAAKKFRNGDTDTKKALVREVSYKQTVGDDFYDVTKYMSDAMRSTFFGAYGDLQLRGDLDDPGLSVGFEKALFEKRVDRDPGDGSALGDSEARTALERTFLIADAELAQAKTEEEKMQIRRQLREDMLEAAQDEVAADARRPEQAPGNPAADLDTESLFVDEAAAKAAGEAGRNAAEAEHATPATP